MIPSSDAPAFQRSPQFAHPKRLRRWPICLKMRIPVYAKRPLARCRACKLRSEYSKAMSINTLCEFRKRVRNLVPKNQTAEITNAILCVDCKCRSCRHLVAFDVQSVEKPRTHRLGRNWHRRAMGGTALLGAISRQNPAERRFTAIAVSGALSRPSTQPSRKNSADASGHRSEIGRTCRRIRQSASVGRNERVCLGRCSRASCVDGEALRA